MIWRIPSDRSLWHMILSPTIWSLHFVAVYCTTAVICAWSGDADTARLAIGGLTAVALPLIGLTGWRGWRQWDYLDDRDAIHDAPTEEHRREFLGHVGFLLSIVSAVGVIYVSMPPLFLESCQ